MRVTPREVHICDVDFLDRIYPSESLHKRDKDRVQTQGLNVGLSTSGTIEHDLHRRRRGALRPFFNKRNVSTLEVLIKGKIEQLCNHLISLNGPVNLYDLYYALARECVFSMLVGVYDEAHQIHSVVFEHSFGRESNMLADPDKAAHVRKNLTGLLRGVKMYKHFYWLFKGLNQMPVWVLKKIASPGAKDMQELRLVSPSQHIRLANSSL